MYDSTVTIRALDGSRLRTFVAFFLCLAISRTAGSVDSLRDAVSRSDIFVGQPNILPTQAMALGNGRLGVALWAADGMTIQLNRNDTLPSRLSPGQVLFPGFKAMIADRAFRGRLRLFDGVWSQTGAGMHVTVAVEHDRDRVIVSVEGADPAKAQSVILKLWEPRSPAATVRGGTVTLAEHWVDDKLPGASGQPFGSLAAVRVDGSQLTARLIDQRQLAIQFRPHQNGTYRVIIAAPSFDGRTDPNAAAAASLAAPPDSDASERWWNELWRQADLVTAWSPDGRAQYFEALRTLFIYYSAAQSGDSIPGSQAGVADLFSAAKDRHFWDPAAFWLWNLRMQVAANLAAGLPQLNEPFFALYRNNLPVIEQWTRAKMQGRDGICVPETMRFNGVGVEFESQEFRPFPIITHSCDATWSAVGNARTLSSGAELALWIWETYQKTGDRRFLEMNYELMAKASRFLLAYQQRGEDGKLHTVPSNAHETQSDVRDPTTDLAAIRALYPATIAAAHLLARDVELSERLANALTMTPDFPVMPAMGTPDRSLPANAQKAGHVIAPSYDYSAPAQNSENIGLEPVWPYGTIGRDHALFETAQRTYAYRPFRGLATWSNDPIHAARLGFGDEVASSLDELTQLYQTYPNGLANAGDGAGEFYIEQLGVVAVALSETLVQDQDGYVVIAPAVPAHWTMRGGAYVRGNAHIRATIDDGQLREFELVSNTTHLFRIRNPWPGHTVIQTMAVDGESLRRFSGDFIEIVAEAGTSYRFRSDSSADSSERGWPKASEPGLKTLGRVSIGLGEPCCQLPHSYNPAADRTIGRRSPDIGGRRRNEIH